MDTIVKKIEDGGPRKVLFIFFGAIAGFMILLCCLFYAVFRSNMQCFDFDQHQYEKKLDRARAQLMAARQKEEHEAPPANKRQRSSQTLLETTASSKRSLPIQI